MREVRGCAVHSSEFEFALLRCKDGILDLEHALVEDWSPIRSCEAVRAFLNLIDVYGGDRGLWARVTRHGSHYDQAFPGFTERSRRYIEALIDHQWEGEWPFAADWQPAVEVALRKLALKAGWRRAATYQIYLAAPSVERFRSETRDYLDDVLSGAAGAGDDIVVTHNALEPFNPTRGMRFFDDMRIIVVDRDPRDVYVAAHRYVGKYQRKGWAAATTGNVESFVDVYRTYRRMVISQHDDSRVLRVSFEQLVTDYDHVVAHILKFIGKSREDHVTPRRFFDPARSAAGVEGWRSFHDRAAIEIIEQALPEFCYRGAPG